MKVKTVEERRELLEAKRNGKNESVQGRGKEGGGGKEEEREREGGGARVGGRGRKSKKFKIELFSIWNTKDTKEVWIISAKFWQGSG